MTFATDTVDAAPRGPRRMQIIGVGALAAIFVTFVLVAIVWPPDGSTRGDFWRFIGRWHPALIHLPIGLLALVPILELAGMSRRFAHLRASAGFVLWLGAIAAVGGAGLGYTLARADGNVGQTVTLHMIAGLATAGLSVAALALRPIRSRAAIVGYAVSLALLMGTMTIAGHLGGQLTYGESYFSSVAPKSIAWLLGPIDLFGDGGPPAPPAAKTDLPDRTSSTLPVPTSLPSVDRPVAFGADVMPVFAQSCLSCHGPAKVKGGLRLDSYAELMKGGDSGPTVEPGKAAASDVYHRMTLPLDDDDVMPPRNAKRRPTPEQVAIVKRWIESGAKGD